ncbi:putative MFS transporter, AGZA family, xanthine/uracil permease [Desulfonispora thiosulfatigenes DSM 11270]|uniref:Putative MFS transporter, AGZA family, xanthine/uracil permease n=1 Tax=Desulfonispora thiosulfatigenes DSM 11270 TaxID=656914 RepID=A0A1W1UF40_DESTI|nr:xanthine/uracil/vitamin C permease [Desulfonispora thiosulfatigenes]SMB79643.1 putative MFS transporter, AGZA family, xanthine/uracil permease [Desulfonispora thiosulfatigenes DSM 11270]
MTKSEKILPLFNKGDIGGLTYILTNNIVNYIIVIATLSGVLGWPDEIVYGRVIPGMSMGLLFSGLYYAYMARKLAKKEGRTDVTALPSGVSTPAMFVILFGVIMPLHYGLNDPELAWSAAVAACFIGGSIEFLGGFIGPWLKREIPRAALLGTVAGIGFIWMATQGVFDLFSDPVVGLPVLLVGMIGVFGGYMFPKRIPPFVVAILGGILYALLIGRTHVDFSGIGFFIPNPANSIQALINGFAIVIPYLTIIIPVEIYNFIETMDNVEAAQAAGDNYSVREAQFADGVCTMISAACGGVVPNTVWLGHAGLKKAGANIGFSWVGGILLALAGVFGLFTFFSALVPPAIAAITYLWCSIVMLSQAFRACDRRHYAGIGIAMVPPIADFLFTQITGAVGLADVWTETLPSGLVGYGTEITQSLAASGVMWNGVPAVKSGAIIIGIILGTLTVFIIDRRLDKAGYISLAGAVLSFFGFIHSAALGIFPESPFMIGYLTMAVTCFILHSGRDKWFDAPDDFDYV